ncbi:MAG: extracellular solute-binding protein, partial [Alphaproteobacteria bacterium]
MSNRQTARHATIAVLSVLLCGLGSVLARAEPVALLLWRHQTGNEEVQANLDAIARFNAAQDRWRIEVELLPQASYTQSITAAALAGRLPCILDLDQPVVPTFVWAGLLRPLRPHVPGKILAAVVPSARGTYKGRIYSIGQFDVALALFTRRSIIDAVGVRIPSLDSPWSLAEFEAVLVKIKAQGAFRYPLSLNTNPQNVADWWTYAFSPMLQSFGGDLIDQNNMWQAEGVLNGPAAIAWGQWFQSLFARGYVHRHEPDDQAFQQQRVALAYSGSWYTDDYARIYGEDLLVLPPPDLGHGTKIGAGSWQWAISRTCPHPDGAGQFIAFLMQAEEIAAISQATGLVPVTEASAALTRHYRPGGDWRLFYEMMVRYGQQRPPTPAFTFISSTFYKAARDIADGANVRDALDDAVDIIEMNIADNKGYGFPRP